MDSKRGTVFVFITSLSGNLPDDNLDRTLSIKEISDPVDWPDASPFGRVGYSRVAAKKFFDERDLAIIKIDGSLMIGQERKEKSLYSFWKALGKGDLDEAGAARLIQIIQTIVDEFYKREGVEEVDVILYIHWSTTFWRGPEKLFQSLSQMEGEIRDQASGRSYTLTDQQKGPTALTFQLRTQGRLPNDQLYRISFHRYTTQTYDGEMEERRVAAGIWKILQEIQTMPAFRNYFMPPEIKAREQFVAAEESLLSDPKLCHYLLSRESKENFDLDIVNPKWQEVLSFNSKIYDTPKRFRRKAESPAQDYTPKSGSVDTLTNLKWTNTLRVRFVYLAYQGEAKRKRFAAPGFSEHKGLEVLVPIDISQTAQHQCWEANLIELFRSTIEDRLKLEVECLPYTGVDPEDQGKSPHLLVALALMEDFNNSDVYDLIAARRSFVYPNKEVASSVVSDYVPVLTIGLMNIMAYYHDLEEYNAESPRQVIKNAYDLYLKLQLDARFRFFDSSIWFQYVAITQYFARDLELAVHNFRYNLETGVFNTVDAAEFLEFQLRILQNSKVANLAPPNQRETASFITPFAFHPESRMRRLALDEMATIQGLPWKLFLVDDQATTPLSLRSNNGGVQRTPTKQSIIRECLQGAHFPDTFEAQRWPEEKVEIVSEENIHRAFQIISGRDWHEERGVVSEGTQNPEEQYFNVILLNYLFEYNRGRLLPYEASEYGFSMIRKLSRWILQCQEQDEAAEEMLERLGPLRRLYFLPVSSFMEVMNGKLKDLGIPLFHQHWEIGSGVDPICTPQLFRYHLFYMLRRQLGELVFLKPERKSQAGADDQAGTEGVFDQTFWEAYKKTKAPQSLMLNLMEQIVEAEMRTERLINLQYAALRLFPEFVELGVKFKTLYKFRHIPFARSLIDRYFFGFDVYAWDHLQHLIYLLTYGTFQQKQEMWEEYIYLSQIVSKKQYELARDKTQDSDLWDAFQRLRAGLKKIADYVIQLGNYNK